MSPPPQPQRISPRSATLPLTLAAARAQRRTADRLIPLHEWARYHGVNRRTARYWAEHDLLDGGRKAADKGFPGCAAKRLPGGTHWYVSEVPPDAAAAAGELAPAFTREQFRRWLREDLVEALAAGLEVLDGQNGPMAAVARQWPPADATARRATY